MPATRPPEELLARLRRARRVLLTSHANPDGDAVGSCLAFARILRQTGKSAQIWLRDAVPPVYRPLPGAEHVVSGEQPPAGFPEAFDALVVLECPTLDRSGLETQLAGMLPTLNVDHHLGNAFYGEVNWVDPAAPSVGEMVQRLAAALSIPLHAEAADLLLLTLFTDTGGFRFSNATTQAFKAAAALIEAGASPPRVSRWVYESQSIGSVRLLGLMLATLELHADGRIATALLPTEMLAAAGAAPGDTEGLIDVPRAIAGVEAVALFRFIDAQRVKVSLRSRGAVDVEAIARARGGGGHHNAAGCQLEGPIAELRAEIVAALTAALEPRE